MNLIEWEVKRNEKRQQKGVGELIERLEPEEVETLKALGTQLLNEKIGGKLLIDDLANVLIDLVLLLKLYNENDVLKRSDFYEKVKE